MNYLAPAKVLKGAAVFALLLSSSLILDRLGRDIEALHRNQGSCDTRRA